MTRSKSKKDPAVQHRQPQKPQQKQQQRQNQPQQQQQQQQEDPAIRLKKDIRKDMRTTFMNRGRIDKDFMISKYLARFPHKADQIRNVVHSYANEIDGKSAKGTANWGASGKKIEPPKQFIPEKSSKLPKDKKFGVAKGKERSEPEPVQSQSVVELDPWAAYDYQNGWGAPTESFTNEESTDKKKSKKSNENPKVEWEADAVQSTNHQQDNGWSHQEESFSIPKEPKGKKSKKFEPEQNQEHTDLVQSTNHQQDDGWGLQEESIPKEPKGKESKNLEPEPNQQLQSTNYQQDNGWGLQGESITIPTEPKGKKSKKANENKKFEPEPRTEGQVDSTNYQQNGWGQQEESIQIPKEPKGKKSKKSNAEPQNEKPADLVQSSLYQQNGWGQQEESTPKEEPKGKKSKKSKENKKTEPEPQKEEHADLVQSTNAILNEFKEHLATQRLNPGESNSLKGTKTPDLERQLQFLSIADDTGSPPNGEARSIENAVLVSPILEDIGNEMPSQFGLLGHLASCQSQDLMDPRVMLNTNIPFSAFICGLQGSGKSHTTSCMIENCSLPIPSLGVLKKPLSTLVLHYNEYSSNVSNQPSEAAFLASTMPEFGGNYKKSIPVRVLTSPSNFHNLEKMYSQIPSVTVQPFRLQPRHLNIATMLSLMSMGKKDSKPLYMAQLTRVLREMALTNQGRFNYFEFRKRLKDLHLDRSQTPFLEQRLDLLDSFLDLKGSDRSGGDYFVDGGVTILDLSCPFMDQDTACILFRIAIDLFLHAHPSRGKLIVADEAHKYMTNTEAAIALTETFLNIIRQQRHLGTRIIISTQEPTVSPRLIDLCSITIVHRFSSPEWYQTIKKHIAIGDKKKDDGDDTVDGIYQISSLRTGEALVYAPSAYLLDGHQEVMDVKDRTFKMVIRKRITWDGGQTIKVVR